MGSAETSVIGVIGGSGVYQMDGISVVGEHDLTTPFGNPSDAITEANIGGKRVFFLPRHGRGHRLLPSEVPYRANIYALKQLGVTTVLAVSAVGIMKEDIQPGDVVIPDQLYDRTKGVRSSTFFGDGCVGHVAFADPFCHVTSDVLATSAQTSGATVHRGGTYVCIEGPQFSTRAESKSYRESIHPVVIGMTAIPEAKLAREAELCYGMLALATDYDCWHESEEDVSVEAVLAVLKKNSTRANNTIIDFAKSLPCFRTCPCHSAGKYATITQPSAIPAKTKERLSLFYGKYWN